MISVKTKCDKCIKDDVCGIKDGVSKSIAALKDDERLSISICCRSYLHKFKIMGLFKKIFESRIAVN